MGLLIFICITVFLIIRLNDIIGMQMGFKHDFSNDGRFNEFDEEESSIHEVHRENEAKISADFANNVANFSPEDFLDKSKKAFEVIFAAYANGDKSTLRELLAPKLYSAFCMAIDDRHSRGETLEGILVRFVSAEIIETSTNDENAFVTVKFLTEQSNVLRDRNGMIIEGNSNYVEHRQDTWIFSHRKTSISRTWLLYEIIDA